MMSLFDQILNVLKPSDNLGSEEKAAPPMESAFLINLPQAPEKKSLEFIAAFRHYVYICIDARAKEVSNIKLHLYKNTKGEYKEIENHEILDLLYKPNALQTQSSFFHSIQGFKDLLGEVFIWKERIDNSKKIQNLWVLRPDWVEVNKNKKTGLIESYTYSPNNSKRKNESLIILADDMIHLKNFNPQNTYRGLSPLKAGAVEVDTYDYLTKWNKNFFYNSARLSGILSTDNALKSEVRQRIRTEWEANYQGKENAFKVALLEAGLKFQEIGHTQRDMDFPVLKNSTRDDILAIYQVPKSIIGITDDVNRANAREARASFQEFVIDPLMRTIISDINEMLITKDFSADFWLDFDPPYPQDTVFNLKYYESGIRDKWLTVNEVRQRENLPPLNATEADNPFEQTQSSVIPTKSIKKDGRAIYFAPPYKPKSPQEKLTDDIKNIVNAELMPEIAKVFSANSKKKINLVRTEAKTFTKEQKILFWKNFDERAAFYEQDFTIKLRRLFIKQETETVARLRKSEFNKYLKTKSLDKILINVDTEGELFADALIPILLKLIRDQGQEAIELVNPELVFNPAEIETLYMSQEGGKFVSSINETTRDELRVTLTEGIDKGEGINLLVKRIQTVYSNANTVRAEMIARTETIRASNFATEQSYKQSGVIVYKEWLTEQDGRQCPFCDSLDGKRIKIGQDWAKQSQEITGVDGSKMTVTFGDIGFPPLHVSCRCTILPVIE